jgi:hypothetical protein
MPDPSINLVKVFSATKAADRDRLGAKVTQWLATQPALTLLRTVVLLSSDSAFHCLSMVLIGHDAGTRNALESLAP